MCLYCGCTVILNRREEIVEDYINTLLQEISLISQELGMKFPVSRIHFGGGTPSRLSRYMFEKLFHQLHKCFDLSQTEEIAIEIDPRSLRNDMEKAEFSKILGLIV